jgi:hypothetical protein
MNYSYELYTKQPINSSYQFNPNLHSNLIHETMLFYGYKELVYSLVNYGGARVV